MAEAGPDEAWEAGAAVSLENLSDPIGDARQRFAAAGQEHVFRFWEQLDPSGQQRLLAQAAATDPGALRAASQASAEAALPDDLAPAPVTRIPEHGGNAAEFERAREAGDALLAAGRVAALVVAGGQGTRLGHPGPKGSFPIGPISGRSLFGLQAQRLRGIERRFGKPVPWLVMTSPSTDAATRALFEREACFGLSPEDVIFFTQSEVPCVDFEGRVLLQAPDRMASSPDGHGGVIAALDRAGVLDRLAERGVDTLSYYQVDNPLARIGDPVLLGFHALSRAEISSKAVAKAHPAERVGTLARSGGHVRVVEYTEIREPERSQRGADGELAYWAGAIGIHAMDVGFLARAAANVDAWLPYHRSPKKIPCLDEAGTLLQPSEPNGLKLERFIFDALPHARVSLVEVRREQEYAPLKNAEGGESPATARAALSACARGWLRAAGVAGTDDEGWIEVDHSVIDGVEDVRALGIREACQAPQWILTASGGTA